MGEDPKRGKAVSRGRRGTAMLKGTVIKIGRRGASMIGGSDEEINK